MLQLHLWEGLEPREIGEVLGLPGTVRQAAPVARPGPVRELLGNDPPAAGHIQGKQPTPIREEER